MTIPTTENEHLELVTLNFLWTVRLFILFFALGNWRCTLLRNFSFVNWRRRVLLNFSLENRRQTVLFNFSIGNWRWTVLFNISLSEIGDEVLFNFSLSETGDEQSYSISLSLWNWQWSLITFSSFENGQTFPSKMGRLLSRCCYLTVLSSTGHIIISESADALSEISNCAKIFQRATETYCNGLMHAIYITPIPIHPLLV